LAHACAREKVALVCGTTGLDRDAEHALDEAAKQVAVLYAPNMSFGVHVLAELVTLAVKKLGLEFDVEIVEAHHKAKIDAPSGTAKRLTEAARAGRESLIRETRGRDGNVGARKKDEIGVHAIRGGDVVGDHTVMLLGQGERLELTHRATSRDLFARGALRAARFVVGKPAGRYTIADVVG
jgi:4-hydroxy-tetrahydrodipicolinate reductase